MRYSWPGVFLLGASGRMGRFFTQLLFHKPFFSLIAFQTFVTVYNLVYFLSLCFSSVLLYSVFFRNKPNAWLEASHTQGLFVFCVGSN